MRHAKKSRFKFNIYTLPVKFLKFAAVFLIIAALLIFIPWGAIGSVFDPLSVYGLKGVLNCGDNPAMDFFNSVKKPELLFYQSITAFRYVDESQLVNLTVNKNQSEFFYDDDENSTSGSSSASSSSGSSSSNQTKPVMTVNILPKSGDGYLTWSKVFIKNTSKQKPSVDSLMREKLVLNLKKASVGPQVLILHTHATEGFNQYGDIYYPSISPRSTDNNKNVVKVGTEMINVLKAKGINAIHSEKQHDYPEFTDSYKRSLETAQYYIKKYPTIKVVLDIHRDTIIKDGVMYRPVVSIGGKRAAQVMIVCGTGTSTAPNSHWKENLKFATTLQQKLETKYPGIARPILMRDSRYNSHVANGALLIEIGTDGNSLDEAVLGGKYTAEALSEVIKANL